MFHDEFMDAIMRRTRVHMICEPLEDSVLAAIDAHKHRAEVKHLSLQVHPITGVRQQKQEHFKQLLEPEIISDEAEVQKVLRPC